MAEPDVFQLADRALARVVAQIAPDQWEMILPASFTTRARPEPPSLRTLVNYHAYDDAKGRFPKGWKALKPYLRVTPQPNR